MHGIPLIFPDAEFLDSIALRVHLSAAWENNSRRNSYCHNGCLEMVGLKSIFAIARGMKAGRFESTTKGESILCHMSIQNILC